MPAIADVITLMGTINTFVQGLGVMPYLVGGLVSSVAISLFRVFKKAGR
jgi:hypothetical protein